MTKNRAVLAGIAAILVVTIAIITAGLQPSQKDAYGQQVPPVAPALNQSSEKTISVTGSATNSVIPDLVTVQFGVDTQAKTAKEAISSNSQMMNGVVSAVQNVGVNKSEISTAGFSIYPIYNNTIPDPRTGLQNSVLVGYRALNTLYVKTAKLASAGDIIDAAVGAGANRVDSVSFSLSPEKQQSIQDDLLGQAVLNAKSRAEKALDPLGQKIIGVKSVSLSEFNMPPPPVYYGAMKADVASYSTPIFTSNQDVTTTVSVIFLIGIK